VYPSKVHSTTDDRYTGPALKKRTGHPKVAGLALGAFLTALTPLSRAGDPAQTSPDAPAPDPPMPVDLALDLSITLGGSALWVTSQLLAPTLAPSSCQWCDRADDGTDTLNGFDAYVRSVGRWSNTGQADTLSDVFSFGLAPLAGFGVGALVAWHDDRLAELPADALVVAESTVIAMNVNQIAKFVFGRQRPDVHARLPVDRMAQQATEDNLSFFSGHTTLAFALATSAGTVASMRHHRLAPVMWTAGLLVATTGGYLRIAADRHYATDVMAGAIAGAAIGFGVPYFAHRPRAAGACLAVVPVQGGGFTVAFSGKW
jgi:membrane-associated phospholipid phosphatase